MKIVIIGPGAMGCLYAFMLTRAGYEAWLMDYKKEIVSSMNWYKDHAGREKSDRIIKGSNYLIINAKDSVLSTMIGTIASMISKNNEIDENIFVLSMARNPDGTTKVSLRVSGNPEGVDLKSIVSELV